MKIGRTRVYNKPVAIGYNKGKPVAYFYRKIKKRKRKDSLAYAVEHFWDG